MYPSHALLIGKQKESMLLVACFPKLIALLMMLKAVIHHPESDLILEVAEVTCIKYFENLFILKGPI